MSARIMVAKFPGTCRKCGSRISRGESIAWLGRGEVYHEACTAIGHDVNGEPFDEDAEAGLEPGTLASDRNLSRRGITVVRTSSGWSGTRNSKGRCEDAPCCGCCTF